MQTREGSKDWSPVSFHIRNDGDVPKAPKPPKPQTPVTSAREDYEDSAMDNPTRAPASTIGLRAQIVKARTGAKMTQSQLAQRLNVLPRLVQDIESGKVAPTGGVLQKMSKVLGVKF